MSTKHIVEPGDCMPSIARQYGFVNWHVIWDAPDNDDLRKKHPNPETLAPGDEVVIPDKKPKEISVAKGASADTKMKSEKTLLRLVVYADPDEKAPKGKWELHIQGVEDPEKGDIPGDGTISVEVPPVTEKAELWLFLTGGDEPEQKIELTLGELDPASTVAGAQERLRRLGFECGEIDGEMDVRTQSALLTFQEENGLEATGELDEDTVNKLVDVFEGGGAYPKPEEAEEDDDDKEKVSLTLSWPSDVIDQLPDDLTIVLDGTEQGPISVAVADADDDGENVTFEFEWETPESATTLKAQAGGDELVLWQDQVPDGDDPVEWSDHLESWLPDQPAFELASLDAGPGEDFVLAAKAAKGDDDGADDDGDGSAVASNDDSGQKGVDINLGVAKVHLGIG